MVKSIKNLSLFLELLQLCDLLTSECISIQTAIKDFSQLDVKHIPNGFMNIFPQSQCRFTRKNSILTVGRLDAPEKQTILTVKAFLAAQLPDWELRLVGPMSVSFQEELRLLLDSQPLAAQVTMVGPIFDKVQLEEEYRKAKIFA